MNKRLSALIIAVTLMTQTASAQDDNVVHIDQDGRDNSGDITQSGVLNQLGTPRDPALQSGFYNLLTLTQRGAGNTVGTEGAGLDQNGQGATPSVFNRIVIDQQTDFNTVGEVQQTALGTLSDGANRLDIVQDDGPQNRIGSVTQVQDGGMPGQTASLVQTGTGNVIERVTQRSLTPANDGENRIRAEFVGIGNGNTALSGFAEASRAPSSALVQTIGDDGLGANGNQIDLLVIGDFNRFGVFQGGRLNSVGQITIEGSQNQIGLRQDGLENDLTVSLIQGDGNDIGLEQWGTNTAYLDMPGSNDDNAVSIFQSGTNDVEIQIDGDRNTVVSMQDYNGANGTGNQAAMTVSGSDNALDLMQLGENLALIEVTGARNNSSNFQGTGLGLTAGEIRQTGTGNIATAGIEGDENLFAVSQMGAGNLAAILSDGTANEAELLQSGASNSAALRQVGRGNTATISQ